MSVGIAEMVRYAEKNYSINFAESQSGFFAFNIDKSEVLWYNSITTLRERTRETEFKEKKQK